MPIVPSGSDASASVRDTRRLSTLLDISRALSGTLDLTAALRQVLSLLARHDGVLRGAVTLVRHGELRVEAAEEADDRVRSIRRAPDDELAARVIATAAPLVVPRAGGGPHRENSVMCVPIVLNRAAVGALSVEVRLQPDRDADQRLTFLGIVGSMIGQALTVRRLVDDDQRKLVDENTHLRQELRERYDLSTILGTSGPARRMYEQIAQVAATNTTVLIRGESGTGKELVANAIHQHSLRAKKPLVKVSCAALPETLIESELFGYERGAFTGADARKQGRFEMAEGGTLFLDEIGDVSPATQVKLLRVLQQREFERLGGTGSVQVNVRLIAATNRDLEKAIADGSFREDLYYRLNVFAIFVPPLRERKADVLLLADHFLERFARQHGKAIRRISTPAIDMLAAYPWPGNVRELENAVERAVLVCDGAVIHGHHLPPALQVADASGTVTRVSLKDAVGAYERDLLIDALKTARGNRQQAARVLDTTLRIFSYKLRAHGIDASRFRTPPPGAAAGDAAAGVRAAS